MNDNISRQMAEANGKTPVLPPELVPIQTPEDVGEETPETQVKQ